MGDRAAESNVACDDARGGGRRPRPPRYLGALNKSCCRQHRALAHGHGLVGVHFLGLGLQVVGERCRRVGDRELAHWARDKPAGSALALAPCAGAHRLGGLWRAGHVSDGAASGVARLDCLVPSRARCRARRAHGRVHSSDSVA
eukprot:Amastigsp_a175319_881.p3 type:complete len:144 gc:universal Amastigsp_a175319_881:413-844(+)